jgi:hypothetical protein
MMQKLRERLGLAWRLLAGREDEFGFFVGYPYMRLLPPSINRYAAFQEYCDARRDAFEAQTARFSQYLSDFRSGVEGGRIPWARNGQFPKLDVIAAYCIVRENRPARIIEIGSGTSTHVLSHALSDNRLGGLTCIDPRPRRSIEDLDVSFLRRVLQDTDADLFSDFQANDVLFIDSSHLMFPGSDTDIQFNRIFPALRQGTLVHVHDIFLPDGYPDKWNGRFYSEQNALMGWIISGYFDIVYPGYYVATQMSLSLQDVLGDLMPSSPHKEAGSIWLRKS